MLSNAEKVQAPWTKELDHDFSAILKIPFHFQGLFLHFQGLFQGLFLHIQGLFHGLFLNANGNSLCRTNHKHVQHVSTVVALLTISLASRLAHF